MPLCLLAAAAAESIIAPCPTVLGPPDRKAFPGPLVRTVQPFCPYRSRLLMPLFSRALFVPSAPHFSFRAVSCQEATERLQARGSNRLEIVRKGKSLSLGSGWIFPSITTRNHPGAQRKLIWRTCVQRASRPAVAPRRDPSKHADKANRVSQSVGLIDAWPVWSGRVRVYFGRSASMSNLRRFDVTERPCQSIHYT